VFCNKDFQQTYLLSLSERWSSKILSLLFFTLLKLLLTWNKKQVKYFADWLFSKSVKIFENSFSGWLVYLGLSLSIGNYRQAHSSFFNFLLPQNSIIATWTPTITIWAVNESHCWVLSQAAATDEFVFWLMFLLLFCGRIMLKLVTDWVYNSVLFKLMAWLIARQSIRTYKFWRRYHCQALTFSVKKDKQISKL